MTDKPGNKIGKAAGEEKQQYHERHNCWKSG